MPIKKNAFSVSLSIIGLASILTLLFFSPSILFGKETVKAAWKEEFVSGRKAGGSVIPDGWKLVKKPGTRPAVFLVHRDPRADTSFLHMESDKASASLVTDIDGFDPQKEPILRWRWRADVLPDRADGRVKSKDDQAIAIYAGTGSAVNNKSVSYRWDTETPRGAEGNCTYGLGARKIKWHTLRNKYDSKGGEWFVEERNVVEDFKKAWGFYPDHIYLAVSCNSQYTGSRASADLDWIELTSLYKK